ncbi:MAG: TIGR03084 family protein [Acidimicrobiia bacterium]|nr:TIGR03084 family protein [Acidimicrobiia bacterium]
MDVTDVLRDLVDEQSDLDRIVAPLTPEQWATPTDSPRWNVADQIGHLAYFDSNAALAITDPDAFKSGVAELMSQITADEAAIDDLTLAETRAMQPQELLSHWRRNRELLADASTTLENDTRIDWYGPSMGSKSFLTARLMECWAHGQNVADAVGFERKPTDRLQHIARLGFNTRGWSYVNRGLEVPAEDVRVEVTAPSGAVWSYGPEDAAETVSGSALEFCLVVTQRRNVHDTELVATPVALDWLEKAQAFAGPPT